MYTLTKSIKSSIDYKIFRNDNTVFGQVGSDNVVFQECRVPL
jgi:hypothetical protein